MQRIARRQRQQFAQHGFGFDERFAVKQGSRQNLARQMMTRRDFQQRSARNYTLRPILRFGLRFTQSSHKSANSRREDFVASLAFPVLD